MYRQNKHETFRSWWAEKQYNSPQEKPMERERTISGEVFLLDRAIVKWKRAKPDDYFKGLMKTARKKTANVC